MTRSSYTLPRRERVNGGNGYILLIASLGMVWIGACLGVGWHVIDWAFAQF